jgi:hypothetical protein
MSAGNGAAQVVADISAFLIRSYPMPADPRFNRVAAVLLALGDEVALLFRLADRELRTEDGYWVGNVRRPPARPVDANGAEHQDHKAQEEASLNRLLAEALRHSDDLIHALVSEAGAQLPPRELRYDISQRSIQVVASGAMASDTDVLEITVSDGGLPICRVWAECRLEALERRSQLPGLFAALQAIEPPVQDSRLIAVVSGHRPREFVPATRRGSTAMQVRVLTWFDVKDLVIRAGDRRGEPGWLDAPPSMDDAADLVAFHAFITSLEDLGSIFRARALTPRSVEELRNGNELGREKLVWLIWRACFSDSVAQFGRPKSLPQLFEASEDALLLSLKLDAHIDQSWLLAPEIDGHMSVAVGIEAEGHLVAYMGAWILDSRIRTACADLGEWEERLTSADFEIIAFSSHDDDGDGEELLIARRVPLPEIVAMGSTVREQEAGLAELITRAMSDLTDPSMSPTARA